MYSVWFGCKTCRRSFLKLDDLFEHKEVHPFVERRIQGKDQSFSFSPSSNMSDLGLTKKSNSQPQLNPFVLFKRLSRQEVQTLSVSKTVRSAKYTVKALHTLTHTKKKKQTRKGSTIKFGKLQFKCEQPYCRKTFHLRRHFTNHIATHSDARPFKCPQPNCLQAFKIKEYLRKHLAAQHDTQTLTYPSKNFGSSFKEKLHLRKDLFPRSDGRQFICSHKSCSRTFNNKSSLWYHTKTHSDQRPLKCPEANCEKSFKLKLYLQRHLLSHSDAKPFTCFHQNCDKAFKFRDKLIRHLNSRRHSDSPNLLSTKLQLPIRKTFQIETETIPSSQATQHAVNFDSRPFICKQVKCGQRFALKANLKRHLLTVHSDEKPFKCPESTCEFKCADKSSLKRHIIGIHSTIIN